MGATIAARSVPSGFAIKLAVIVAVLAAAAGLVPADLPLIGDLIGDAHAGINDPSV
jgi:hypothetical protein